jgi:hypothetical protein
VSATFVLLFSAVRDPANPINPCSCSPVVALARQPRKRGYREQRDFCSPAQLIEESRHRDIANGRDEIEYQTQAAMSEDYDPSRHYGDEIKSTRDSGLEMWGRFCDPFLHFSEAHNLSPFGQ